MFKLLTLIATLALLFLGGALGQGSTRRVLRSKDSPQGPAKSSFQELTRGVDPKDLPGGVDPKDIPQSLSAEEVEEYVLSPCGTPICSCAGGWELCNFIAHACCGEPVTVNGRNYYDCSNSNC